MRIANAPFLILLLWPGCNSHPTVGPPVSGAGDALIPLAIGNTWVYVDSLVADSSISAEIYTVRILDSRDDSIGTWWELYDSRVPGSYLIELTSRNDSIFSLQYNEDDAVISLEYIPPSKTDTLHFFSLFGGEVLVEKDIYPLSGQIPVAAGTFDSCFALQWNDSSTMFTEILKPSVGMIRREFSTTLGRHRISLVDFTIANHSPP